MKIIEKKKKQELNYSCSQCIKLDFYGRYNELACTVDKVQGKNLQKFLFVLT